MNEKAIHADEAPPEYAAEEQQPAPLSWKWWWRKRVWMPTSVLVLLVVFGVIFGAVMGVKASHSANDSEKAEQLFASQGWNSSTRWSSYSATPTYSYSYSWSPTPPAYSTSTYGWSSPSPSPSHCPDCIALQPQRVQRDISVAAGTPDLIFWDLRAEGKLWKKEGSGSWGVAADRKFLVAPVSVHTSADSHIAVSVDASSGRVVYQLFRDGQWGEWQELEFGARFARRPAVISRAEGSVDIFAVTEGGHVWQVSYDEANAQWSQWSDLGHDITSEVSATSWGEDRIDVFGKRGKTVMHRSWTTSSGWTQDWDDLGYPWENYYHDPRNPASSPPLTVSWRDGDDGVVDVYMTQEGQGSSHKLFRNSAWSDWTGMSASHEGYEFADTQSIVKGDGVDGRPFAHLLSRGTNDCINYNVHNGTAWGSWKFIWCAQERGNNYPTQFFSTYIVNSGDGKVNLVGRDLESNFLNLEIVGNAPEEWQYPGPLELWKNLGQPA